MRRRTWLIVAAAAAAATFCLPSINRALASPWAVALLFLGACFGVFVVAACGGMMGTLRSETNRRRAGSFYQSGSLAFGAVAVFPLVSLSGRLQLGALGWIVAAMIVLPSLFALAAPAQSMVGEHNARQTAARIWQEFKSTFLRWEAIPYTLLVTFPMCSGAMIGLLPGLARDYGVTGQQVAWINGLAGALLTAAGALAATLIPVRIRAPIAFLLAGLVNAATLAILALGPQRPAVYFAGTVLFLFTIGACYAFFTAWRWNFSAAPAKAAAPATPSSILSAIFPSPTCPISTAAATRIGVRAPCPPPTPFSAPPEPRSCWRTSSSAGAKQKPRVAGAIGLAPGTQACGAESRNSRLLKPASRAEEPLDRICR